MKAKLATRRAFNAGWRAYDKALAYSTERGAAMNKRREEHAALEEAERVKQDAVAKARETKLRRKEERERATFEKLRRKFEGAPSCNCETANAHGSCEHLLPPCRNCGQRHDGFCI